MAQQRTPLSAVMDLATAKGAATPMLDKPPVTKAARYGQAPEGQRQFTLRLDASKSEKLRRICFDRRISQQELIAGLIDDFLEAEGQGG